MENNKILPSSYTVCIYVRLSEEDDDLGRNEKKDESGSITAQRQLIRDYLKSRPEFSSCRIIERCDDGFSGTQFDTRPACTEMIAMAKRGEINCIIVKDFSRFGRNYVELGNYMEQVFPFLGIRFISVNDGYDSDELEEGETPGLSVAFQNLIYDYYSKELSRKAKLSCRQRAEHGLYSSSVPLYGYKKADGEKHRIVRSEPEASIVREIYDMKLGGMKMADIARNLNDRQIPCPIEQQMKDYNVSGVFGFENGYVWTESSIFHILTNEQYTGTLVALKSGSISPGGKRVVHPKNEWFRKEGTHVAIVSREEFQTVQGMISSRGYKRTGKRNVFQCGCCGRMLTDQKKKGSMRCYRGMLSGGGNYHRVEMENYKAREALLTAIKDKVRAYLDKEERRKEAAKERNLEDKIASVERAISLEKKAWMKMYDKYADGKISREDFLKYKQEYDETVAGLNEKLFEMREMQDALTEADAIDLDEADAVLDAEELTQEILDAFVECVEVFDGGRMEIHWRFDPE